MTIQYFCPRWGSENIDWDSFCKKVKDAGYDGVEYAIPATVSTEELDTVWNIASKNNTLILAQHFDTYEAVFSKHCDAFGQWLEKIKPYPVVKINSQTGKDFFSFEQNKGLIDMAQAYGVVHETHRNKFSFAAHITSSYLTNIPYLRLTFDVSHWVCVAESYLDDQPEAMGLAITRADHIHARVGYPEGPQVADPRVPEWQDALQRHLHWWDKVVALKKKENEALTISPEFGPFPYMVHNPLSQQPLADQWEVNRFMLNLLRERYSN